jgi:hypothetical protein
MTLNEALANGGTGAFRYDYRGCLWAYAVKSPNVVYIASLEAAGLSEKEFLAHPEAFYQVPLEPDMETFMDWKPLFSDLN